MCHVVGQQYAEPEPRGSAPPALERLRPRWAAAAGAALIGTFALAFVSPSTEPPVPEAKPATAVTPVVAKSGMGPDRVVEPAAGLDDGVPTVAGKAKAGLGNCSHGM